MEYEIKAILLLWADDQNLDPDLNSPLGDEQFSCRVYFSPYHGLAQQL